MSYLGAFICLAAVAQMVFVLQKMTLHNLPGAWLLRGTMLIMSASMLWAAVAYIKYPSQLGVHVVASQAAFALFWSWVIYFHLKGHAKKQTWVLWN